VGEPKFDLTNGLSTGEARVLSAVALLLVTATAAMFAFRAVRETRKAREQAVRPVLALDLNFISPVGYARIVVANVGQGAAVDADLELSFRPATETGAAPIVRSWTWPLLAPGQTYEFNPPDMDDKFPTVSDLALVWPMVALKGNVRDQLGKVHPVNLVGLDLRQIWRKVENADQAWETDPTVEVLKKISLQLGAIVSEAKKLAAQLGRKG
jgi:hypothetical protein